MPKMVTTITLFLVGSCLALVVAFAEVVPEIECNDSSMDVRVPRKDVAKVHLQKWSSIPGCETNVEENAFVISLKLNSDLSCGLTKIRNKLTDEVIYYHKLIVEESGGRQHLFKLSCFVSSEYNERSNIVKRSLFPPEFVEPDYIDIIREVSGRAPIPELTVKVSQNGKVIGDQITVSPGAPLLMEVSLDHNSSSTYGILVSYMMVTDNTNKNETIIFNGCTQDRYVFENFQTDNGDSLTAKFRAFKFPESNYLMFKGTVDVCLDICQGIRCSSGEDGYGRRKRAIPLNQADPNKIFEVSMMTYLKFEKGPEADEVGRPFLLQDRTKTPRFSNTDQEEIFVRESSSSDDSTAFLFYDAWSAASSHQVPHFSLFLLLSVFLLRIQN